MHFLTWEFGNLFIFDALKKSVTKKWSRFFIIAVMLFLLIDDVTILGETRVITVTFA